jgi:hypothetical protein
MQVATNAAVIAAYITGGITVVGFFLNGWFVTRRIDKGRAADQKKLIELQSDLSLKNDREIETLKSELAISEQKRIAEIQARLSEIQKSRESRRSPLPQRIKGRSKSSGFWIFSRTSVQFMGRISSRRNQQKSSMTVSELDQI